jgi:histidinol-phosphate/aromatic aminotransferase/cobyric acid decarboxylase-like protein
MLDRPVVEHPVRAGISKAVYGLVFPETRETLDRIWASRPHTLFEEAYTDVQDAANDVFFRSWRSWSSEVLRLPELPHVYPTAGSSEAIRESIWDLGRIAATDGKDAVMHVFAGEYEGYAAYARAAGIALIKHDRERWRESIDDPITGFRAGALHRWYVSQPSAIDGNLWPDFDDFLRTMSDRAVDVAVDLAYVGAVARRYEISLDQPCVHTVFFSLSKVFGLFYHRVGGVLTRNAMLGLDGQRWFKNMLSLYTGTTMMDAYGVRELPERYASSQTAVCDDLRRRHGVEVAPSDVLILGSAPIDPPRTDAWQYLERSARSLRFCLTPALDALLRGR